MAESVDDRYIVLRENERENVVVHVLVSICVILVVQTLIENVDIRVQWEKHFPIIEVVEQLPTYRVLYWYVR